MTGFEHVGMDAYFMDTVCPSDFVGEAKPKTSHRGFRTNACTAKRFGPGWETMNPRRALAGRD